MKTLVSTALAIGFATALSGSAFAACASKVTAEGKSMTPIVTADTTVTTNDKG